MAFSKTTDGLIYRDDFSSMTGWTSNAKFSVNSEFTMISFGYLPTIYESNYGRSDTYGARQGGIFIDGDTWYLIYDGAFFPTTLGQISGTKPHSSKLAISKDRGLTWAYFGDFGPGIQDGFGGNLTFGYAMGWIGKYDGVFYLYRVLLLGAGGGPPYYGDIWSCSTMTGTWTYEYEIPRTAATFTSFENLPCSIIKEGSTYYLFIQGSPSTYTIGVMSGSNPDGPFTVDPTPIFSPNFVAGDIPENQKVIKHPATGKFLMIFNTYINSVRATKGYLAVSSSVSNWASKTYKKIVKECPLDIVSGGLGVGVMSPYMNGASPVFGSNGFLPVMYDGNGKISSQSSSDFAWKRSLYTAMLEPSTNSFQYTGTDATSNDIFRTVTNANFVAEFAIEFLTTVASTSMSFWFRNDGTNQNGYKATFRNNSQTVILEKVVGGVTSTVATGTGTQIFTLTQASRCKVVTNGTSIKIYLDGELQIDTTDSSFSSGTSIGISGTGNVTSQIRLLSIRSNDIVTLTGLTPGMNVNLLADGGVSVAHGLANASGQITFNNSHYPLEALEVDGVDLIPSGGIWGGDTITFTGYSSTPIKGRIKKSMF